MTDRLRPASDRELALLRHPDRRTSWVVVAALSLAEGCEVDEAILRERLLEVCERLPILRARLAGEAWRRGDPPEPTWVSAEPLEAPGLLAPFDLSEQAPIRVVVGDGGRRVALAGHHAVLDGRGVINVLGGLVGAATAGPAEVGVGGRAERPWGALRRFARPADRVAPSHPEPGGEVLAVRRLALAGPHLTARVAEACVAAAAAHNAARGEPWRRVGVSLGVGGPPGTGNVATYRRVDLRAEEPVHPAVVEALGQVDVPGEILKPSRALRLLAPVADRFSDSVLVSNPGRYELPGVRRLEMFPVARGRSAVAFGSCGLTGRLSTLSIRARDLTRADAEALLDDVVGRLDPSARPAQRPKAGARE